MLRERSIHVGQYLGFVSAAGLVAIGFLLFALLMAPTVDAAPPLSPKSAKSNRVQADPQDSVEQNNGNASQTESETESTGQIISNVSIGFDGRWCLGKWAPVRFTFESANVEFIELETLDGDGVPVRYLTPIADSQLESIDDKLSRAEALVRVGRYRSFIAIRILDANQRQLGFRRFRFGGGNGISRPQPSTTNLTLSFGSDIDVDSFIGSTRAGQRDRIALHFEDSSSFPKNLEGLECIQSIVITADGISDIKSWTPEKTEALSRWVMRGGHLVISVNQSAEDWFGAQGRLNSLLPGRFNSAAEIVRADELEKYTSADSNRLITPGSDPIKIAHILFDQTIDSDVVQNRMTLIARRAVGFGRITFIMFDLNDPKIVDWNGRNQLISRLLQADLNRTSIEDEDKRSSTVTSVGFLDLSGQLRAPLDQYREVGFINFTTVALLVVAYILLIGPGDYFLMKYVVKRMQWTWVSFPVMTILFCGLAYWIFSANKPDEIRINHVELVDIDMQSGQVRGTIWSQIYSPRTRSHDLQLPAKNKLGIPIDSNRLSWQGLPGNSLGGMQTMSRSSLFQSSYVAKHEQSKTSLSNVPIQVASSKPFLGNYEGKINIQYQSDLEFDPVATQLTGTVVNPLDVELTNCAVFFKNFLIPLDSNLGPGEVFDLSLGNQQDFQSFIKRRVSSGRDDQDEIREVNTQWDKKDTNVPRILRMMMFFNAAGGRGYTELTNDYFNTIDLSSHLDLNRAILVGRIKAATTSLQVDGQDSTKQQDMKWTVIRILYPVKEIRK